VSLTEIASDSTNAPEDAAQARLQLSAQSIVLRVTWPPSPPSSLHALVSASTIGRLVRTVQWMCPARGAPHRVPADRGRQYRSSFAPDRP
jgi:hypothetical protein